MKCESQYCFLIDVSNCTHFPSFLSRKSCKRLILRLHELLCICSPRIFALSSSRRHHCAFVSVSKVNSPQVTHSNKDKELAVHDGPWLMTFLVRDSVFNCRSRVTLQRRRGLTDKQECCYFFDGRFSITSVSGSKKCFSLKVSLLWSSCSRHE